MPDGQRPVNKTDASVLHDKEDQVTGVRSRSSFSFNNLLDTTHFGRISSMDINAEKINGLTDGSHHVRRRRRSSGDSDLVVLSVVFNKKKQKQNDEVAIAIERLRENGVNCVLFTMNDFRNGTRKPESALPDAFRLASGQLPHSSSLTAEKGLSKLSSLPMLPLPSIKCELSENSNGSTDSTSSSNAEIHKSVEKVINSFSPSPSPSPPPLSPQVLPPLGGAEQMELSNGIKSSMATSLHALLSPLLPPTLCSNEFPSSSYPEEPKLQDIQVCSSSSIHQNNKNSKKRRRRVRKPYTHRKAQLKKKLKEIAEVARAARAAQRAARLAISQVSNYNGEFFSTDSMDGEPISSSDQVKRFEDCQSALLDALHLKMPSGLEKGKHFSETEPPASDDVITSNGVDPCLNGTGHSIDDDEDDDNYFPTPDSSSKIEANLEMFSSMAARKRKRCKPGRVGKKPHQLRTPFNDSSLVEETLKFDIAHQNGFPHTNHTHLETCLSDAILEGVGLIKVKPLSQYVPHVNSVVPEKLDLNYVSIDINASKDEPLAIASLLHKKRAFSPDIIRGIRRINTSKLINEDECPSSGSGSSSSCSISIVSDVIINGGPDEEHLLIKRTKIETPNCVHTETISELVVTDVQEPDKDKDKPQDEEQSPSPSTVEVKAVELETLTDEIPIADPLPVIINKRRKRRGRRTGLVVRKYEKSKKKVSEKKAQIDQKTSGQVDVVVEDAERNGDCGTQSDNVNSHSPNFQEDGHGGDERLSSDRTDEYLSKLPTPTSDDKSPSLSQTPHIDELATLDSIAQPSTRTSKVEADDDETKDCEPKVAIDQDVRDNLSDSITSANITLCTSQIDDSKNDQQSSLLETSCLSEQEGRDKKSTSAVKLNGSSIGLGLETAVGPDEPTPGSFKRFDDSLPATPDGMQLRRSNFYSLISDNVRKNMENYLDGRHVTKLMTKRRKRTKNTYLLNHGDNYPEDPEAPYKLHLATQVLLKLNKRRAKCKPKEDRGKSLLSYLKLVPKRPPRTGKPATVSPAEEIKEQSEEPVFSGEWTISRNYICHVCGQVEAHFWDMVMHKGEIHPGVVVTHTELNGPVPPSLVRFPQEESPAEDETIPPCTKCAASFSTIADLHRHIFECAGNAFWLDSDKTPRKRKPKRRRGFKRRFSNTPKSTPKKSKKSEVSVSKKSEVSVSKKSEVSVSKKSEVSVSKKSEVNVSKKSEQPKRRPTEVFKCEFCPREFKTEGWLKNHLVTHSLPISIPLEKLSLPSRASNNSTSCRLFKQ